MLFRRLLLLSLYAPPIKCTTVNKNAHSFIMQLGSTAVGICTSEGVVLAVEKRVTSVLMEPSSIEKILEIDSHIGKSLYVDSVVPHHSIFFFLSSRVYTTSLSFSIFFFFFSLFLSLSPPALSPSPFRLCYEWSDSRFSYDG